MIRRVMPLLAIALGCATPGRTQNPPERRGFGADLHMGYGRLEQSSDQEPRTTADVFALTFGVGVWVNRHVRLGAELGGWLLEAFDWHDPAKGESVSQLRAVARVSPWPNRGLFLVAGAGPASYTNHHPLAFGSSGWGGTIGVGWDLRIGRTFSLSPTVRGNLGGLGGVRNPVATIRNRRYRAIDLGIALTYR